MITIEKNGNAIKFTFDDNGHYLQNGVIEVPINSLSMVMDESDMVTFKRAQSNDIFVSAKYEDFGMTKAELEAWYKNNMVGATGGGGGGSITIDPSLDSGSTNAVANSAITKSVMVDSKMLYDIYPYTSGIYTYTPIEAEYLVVEFNPKATNIRASVEGYVEYQSTRYHFSISVTGDTSTHQITDFNINQGADYVVALIPYGSGKLEIHPRLDVTIKSIGGNNVIINVPKNVSGGTASDIIENVVYEELQDVKSDVNVLYSAEPIYTTSFQLTTNELKNIYNKISKSGITTGSSIIYLGENLRGSTRLNVVASGSNTVEEDINEELAVTRINPEDKGIYPKELAIYINQNYASSSDVKIDISLRNTDVNLARFTYYPSTNTVSNNQESLFSSWSYDQSTYVLHMVTNQLNIWQVRCNNYIAPIGNLTDSSCAIGRVIASYNERSLNRALTVPSQTFVVGGSYYLSSNEFITLEKYGKRIKSVKITQIRERTRINDGHILFLFYTTDGQQYESNGNLYVSSVGSTITGYSWSGYDTLSFHIEDGSLIATVADGYWFTSYNWLESYQGYFKIEYLTELESSDVSSFIGNEGEILQYALDNTSELAKNTKYVNEKDVVKAVGLSVNYNGLTIGQYASPLSAVSSPYSAVSTVNFDDTIKYLDSKLGVYVTGDTHSTPIEYSGKLVATYLDATTNGVEFKKNPQYTGTTDSVLSVRRYIDEEEVYNWAYDSENDTFIPQQEIPSGLALTYDGITVRITTDEGYIRLVRDYDWFADPSNPTDKTCMFQNIYAISNSYKLQDMIDNILSRLSALENNS